MFENLVNAYAEIADALPRFDRYQRAFQKNPEFESILAVVYSEILDFHRHVYKFLRRRGEFELSSPKDTRADTHQAWHIFFDSMWKDFGARFASILQSLAKHRDLVDKEATSIELLEARTWRTQYEEKTALWEQGEP